jgi:hypothetical protein
LPRPSSRSTLVARALDGPKGWDDESVASAVMPVITIERWIAWTDWD